MTDSGEVEHRYFKNCDDGTSGRVWVGDSEFEAAAIDPAALAQSLYDEFTTSPPTFDLYVNPADTDPNGYTYVHLDTFFWVDGWAPINQSLSVGSVSVTLSAAPTGLVVDLGNGEQIACEQTPAPPQGDLEGFDGCGYAYTDSSSVAPNGETFTVTATMTWEASWSSNVGAGGALGNTEVSDSRELPVAESQAIITG